LLEEVQHPVQFPQMPHELRVSRRMRREHRPCRTPSRPKPSLLTGVLAQPAGPETQPGQENLPGLCSDLLTTEAAPAADSAASDSGLGAALTLSTIVGTGPAPRSRVRPRRIGQGTLRFFDACATRASIPALINRIPVRHTSWSDQRYAR
jgi:hypothetical protein